MYQRIARNKRLAVAYIALFFVMWVGIGALVGLFFAALDQPGAGMGRPYLPDAASGMVVLGVLALAAVALALRSGPRLVLAVSRARPADPVRYRQLHDLVEALALGEGFPNPAVYVIDDPSPNAFATGTSPDRAAITVTTGLLGIMNREELEGVLAHEMSHIRNYDVRLLLVVSTLIGIAGVLASMLWRMAFFSRTRGRNAGQAVVVLFAATVMLGLVALVFGPLIRLALSRRREELADVSGVELTRNPAGLIAALRKLSRNHQPFAGFNHATAAMCIDDPLQHHEGWMHRLFDTHPPISERIALLERIALGRAA